MVNEYHTVNLSDVKKVENAAARALKNKTDTEIVYRVWVQYPSNTAAVPQWVFIDVIGNNGYRCQATIENIKGGDSPKNDIKFCY
jgi:hypothetical protein